MNKKEDEQKEVIRTIPLWIKGSIFERIVEDYKKWYRKVHGKELEV